MRNSNSLKPCTLQGFKEVFFNGLFQMAIIYCYIAVFAVWPPSLKIIHVWASVKSRTWMESIKILSRWHHIRLPEAINGIWKICLLLSFEQTSLAYLLNVWPAKSQSFLELVVQKHRSAYAILYILITSACCWSEIVTMPNEPPNFITGNDDPILELVSWEILDAMVIGAEDYRIFLVRKVSYYICVVCIAACQNS